MKRTERLHHTVTQAVLRSISHKKLISDGQHVIVAVSGGIDSMVLLDILASLRGALKIRLSVAHVNFELRGRSSDLDEQSVRKRAAKLRIPFFTAKFETKEFAASKKMSIQEAARDLRYGFFDNLKKSLTADLIATAHNANDNAETMLFHFFRGSGVKGLTGIPVQRGQYVRPLLSVTRKEIEQYAKEHQIKFREDATNLKQDYTRNFIRRTLVPQIEQRINTSLVNTMNRESEIFSLLSDFIDNQIEQKYRQLVKGSSLVVDKALSLHPFLQRATVKRLLESFSIEPSFTAIASVIELLSNQKGSVAEIGDGFVAERTADYIEIRKQTVNQGFEYTVPSVSSIRNGAFTFSIKSPPKQNKQAGEPSKEYVDAAQISFPLTVRSWKPGDVFYPLGMKGRKKLSDFFGERKLTAAQKAEVPVVLSGDRIIWVAGMRLDDRCKITEKTQSTYQLTIKFHGKKNSHR
ncbi:MAG: tRNA lysidine(34) synthetase TilS [Bacteroidota bacterium]